MTPFDCEALRSGFPRQPVNTLSSLGFLVAAVVLWRLGRRFPAAAIGLAGIGSVAYHGAPSRHATVMHDVGLYVAAVAAVTALWRRVRQRRLPRVAILLALVGGAVWMSTRSGGPLCRPEALAQGHALWHVLAATAYALLFAEGPRGASTGNPVSPGVDS